jgi:hypothetical protein
MYPVCVGREKDVSLFDPQFEDLERDEDTGALPSECADGPLLYLFGQDVYCAFCATERVAYGEGTPEPKLLMPGHEAECGECGEVFVNDEADEFEGEGRR